MNRNQRIILSLAAFVLFAGLGLVVIGSRPPPERTFKGTVKDLLPKAEEIPAWTVEYQPIADTPEMKKAVAELLNYDDAVFAIYKLGNMRLSVYIAYWAPGKMSHRLVAGHTPDVCWVGNGWKIEEARSGVRLPNGRGGMLKPSEERTMVQGGQIEHVVFWHLLDGQSKSYRTQGRPPWFAVLSDILSRRLNQQPEQFFIRISSNLAVSQYYHEVVLQRLGVILSAEDGFVSVRKD